MILDLNFEPKKFQNIVAILNNWLSGKFEWEKCQEKLIDLGGIDKEASEWLMDTVNCEAIKDIETHLLREIDEYNHVYEIEYGKYDMYECGHDRYLSTLI